MDNFPFVYDPYSSRNRLLSRLREEYATHGRLIIAVDFDDTIFDTHHHGWRYDGVVDTLKRWDGHATFILWTASLPDRYPQLREVWTGYGLPDDIIINENAPGIPSRGPKIYANIYIDDRSCGIADCIVILNRLADEVLKK